MKVYTYMTLITTLVFLNMCGGVVLLPVFFISPGAYRKITTFMLWFSEPGFLCIPFSWAACKVRCNGLGYLIRYVGKDALFISNHSARVDWYLGMFLTTMYCQRVAFVMEYFAMMMPIVGWWRYLVEDMYVVRSFKQDQERLDQNIDGFHTSGVHRWLYLSPEGMIADFSEHDKKYIRDCRRFCEDMSVDPYDYLLTPRYKGMTCFNRLVTEGVSEEDTTQVVSVTMAYCKDGKNLCKPLIDDDRHIPDLFDLLGGGMTVDVHLHMLSLSNNPEVLKGQMMEEYALKDKLLKHFHEHGFFPSAHPVISPPPEGWDSKADPALAWDGEAPWQAIGSLWSHHIRMNVSLVAQVVIIYTLAYYMNSVSSLHFFLAFIWCTLGLGHISSVHLTGGQSRESVPFESIIKSVLFRVMGREGKTPKKGHTRLEEEQTLSGPVGKQECGTSENIELVSDPSRE
jgi:hypothetical protein